MAAFCDNFFFSPLVDICNRIYDIRETMCQFAVIGTGGVITVTFTPVLLGLVGFTQVGIVAGSIAAKLMSWFALFYGGGVPAGGLVAFLQWIGATGMTTTAAGTVASFGGSIGWMLSGICNQTKSQPQCDANP